MGEILGGQPLNKILTEIEGVLGYVQKYQTGSKEKDRIVNDIRILIEGIRSQFNPVKGKNKSGKGKFSLFS